MGLIHLYSATSTSFDGNGTPLVTAREAVVKRDEGFQLTFSIPISQNELHKQVQKEMIVSAMTPDGVNYFRIWDIEKRTTDVKVTALQLLYSLDVKQINPFGGKQYTGTLVLQGFANAFKSSISPYTFSSSINTSRNFYTNEKDDKSTSHNALSILNKITDTWSGELMLNGFDVRMISKLGTKTDALLYEHKNIASFSDSSSMNGIVTRIYATATYTPERAEGATEDPEPVVLTATVDSPLINQYAVIYEATMEYNDARTVNELRTEILKQYSEFNVDKPERTIDVDTNIVDGTAINFGDELVLKYLVHDVDEVIRCVGYEYDPISENYIGVTLGTLEKTFLTKVSEGISSAVSRQFDKLNKQIQVVQASANGKNRVTYGPNPVPNAIEGDLWFKHPEGRPDEVELLIYQNGLWMPAPFLTDQDKLAIEQEMSDIYDDALAEIGVKDTEYKEIFDAYDRKVVLIDQGISDAATKAQNALDEAGTSTNLAETAKDLADELDQKVIDFQERVGSDGNPQYNKNRSTISSAVSQGELIPIKHNGLGYVAGQDMVLSFKSTCVPITKSRLTLNFTADDLLPEPTPKTKSVMTLNLIEPNGAIPPDPDPTPTQTPFANARVVNLSEFGGVGDGSYDNFNAFKSAINQSANEPLVIEVDAGIYNIQGPTNDRIQMEPWESAKSKGIRLVGNGNVEIRHKNNRTVNRHEYYFMQLVMGDGNLGFETENITVNGIRNPQEELFYTQSESNPVPNIPLTRGITTNGAHHVVYRNVEFKNMYGGYAIQMSEYRDVTIKDVTFDKVGGNDIQESFGMAIYLGGHSGNAIVDIDNAQAQGMVTDKGLKLSWIGVVLENGSIQSSNPAAWMRDKNTTVNITNSSFMDYQSTFHVESIAGNVYWNVDGLTARGSNYQVVAGVYGEYKESSNNVKMDMMPYGRLWGIVHGLWYTEAQETDDNISGHNKMDMYNSVINLKTLPGFKNIPQAVSYGNSVKGYLHNTQLNDVPYKLVQNGSAYLYDSVVNLSQASGETRASLQTGMFGTGAQKVVFDNTLVNAYANRSNVTFGAKPAFVKNTGFVAPFIELPISPPL